MRNTNIISLVIMFAAALILVSCGSSTVLPQVPSSGTSTAKSVSITPVGLGESILVTNSSSVTISGVASSDVGLNKVEYVNSTNSTSGTALGTTSWTANITLVQGENNITVTATAVEGTKSSVSFVLTYYPNIDFTTSLTASEETFSTNTANTVRFTIGLADTTGAVVSLWLVDSAGAPLTSAAAMADDGVLPDEIKTDGVYTGQVTFNVATTQSLCYKAKVEKTSQSAYYSETKCVSVSAPLTDAKATTVVTLANNVKSIFASAINASDGAKKALEMLNSSSEVGAAGASGDNEGVWWISNDGILGVYHAEVADEKAAGGSQARISAKTGSTPVYFPEHRAVPYPEAYLKNRSVFAYSMTKSVMGKTTAEDPNTIKSTKAVIISPYISNPDDAGSSFGTHDDYFVPWQTLKDKKACVLFPAAEKLNNGSVTISLDTFKQIGDYGLIHVSTHGDNYYSGLLNLWKPEWGSNEFLKGSLSQVIMYTGVVLPQNSDGTVNITGYEKDLKAKRIALSSDGSVVIMPSFIKYYVDNLPNSLVVLSACRSMFNNSMANAFLARGAGAVIGYTDYVKTSYAQHTLSKIFDEMLSGKTVSAAVASAIATYGSNDNDKDPAYLEMTGNSNLIVSTGTLENAGFENGYIVPWLVSGDGRVITQLGGTSPVEGSYMGIISTGLGYTTSSGMISQDFCTGADINQISFSWDFFSEEFKEYCGSVYQDRFTVSACIIDDTAGTETCSTLMTRAVDDLCASVTASDVSFDQGGVFDTGWNSASYDFSAYAGKHVRLKFSASDVGDSIYDTAILIDNIIVKKATP